jgi:hypothetical protein
MGFSISWIAISGKTKSEVLARLSLVDTTEDDEANESPVSGAQLPNDWYLLFLNDLIHPFVSEAELRRLSSDCTVLGCQIEEHVMASAAFCYSQGARIWNITHEAEKGTYNLVESGNPPSGYSELRSRLVAEQDSEGGDDADVDWIFDIPVSLAYELCGYRHDNVYLKSGETARFTKLEHLAA